MAEISVPPPSPIDAAICDDPAKRDPFLKQADEEGLPLLDYSKQLSERSHQMMTERLDLLAEKAKWTPERKAEFALDLLQDPELGPLFEEAMANISTMMDKLGAMTADEDEASRCRALAEMTAMFPAINANAQKQWAVLRRTIDAEASRLGISLD